MQNNLEPRSVRSQTLARPRDDEGRFIPLAFSNRSFESRELQKNRQKGYIARKKRMILRVLNSFIQKFFLKNEGENHWVPASMDHGPFQELFKKLLKAKYVGSKRHRISVMKATYFNNYPGRRRKLSTLRTRASAGQSATIYRVKAFVGWRFPNPLDLVEMEAVQEWINSNKHFLQVGAVEARNICLDTFHLYSKHGEKYFYLGFPSSTPATVAPSGPQSSLSATREGSNISGTTEAPGISGNSARVNGSQSGTVPGELETYAQRIIDLACADSIYRSFQLLLNPSPTTRLSVASGVWLKSFCQGNLENLCALEKDLYSFAQLVASGKSQCPEHQGLHKHLKDQFEVFRLIRECHDLPLFDSDPWAPMNAS